MPLLFGDGVFKDQANPEENDRNPQVVPEEESEDCQTYDFHRSLSISASHRNSGEDGEQVVHTEREERCDDCQRHVVVPCSNRENNVVEETCTHNRGESETNKKFP